MKTSTVFSEGYFIKEKQIWIEIRDEFSFLKIYRNLKAIMYVKIRFRGEIIKVQKIRV